MAGAEALHDAPVDGAEALDARHGELPADAVLRLSLEVLFPGRIALVTSFGAESAVLLHMVSRIDRTTPVLFIDTERHFEETLRYRDRLARHLGLTDLRSLRPDAARIAAADPERALYDADPDLCCHLRKTEPLMAALGGFDAWISGRKRFQTRARAGLATFEPEPGGARIKVNPLARWSGRDLAAYMDRHALPRHPLRAAGYLSIGCASCTTPPGPSQDQRAGRWAGREKTECGIHFGHAGHVEHGGHGGSRQVASRREIDMDVFRDGRFESDSWQRIDDDAAVPATGPVLVSLTRWRAERDRLTERDAALGLVIAPGDSLDGLADDLGETSRFAVIAIAFPAFTDGRGYSHARILRERHGYAGELRAIGEILIDQIPFMMRVGIDAFRVTDEPTRRRLAEGGVPGVTRHTQPGSSREGRAAGWSWRRHRPAG